MPFKKIKLIIKFITISNTGETLGFEQKDLVREEYNDDVHPLYLYLLGDKEMRSDVLLNHPDVIGYVYLYEDNVRKAFLVNKVVNFKASDPSKRNAMIAVSGDPENYIPFSVPEIDLLSDTLHITDCMTLNKKTPSIGVGKYIKENEKEIQGLPKDFDTDAKIKKLKVVAFPTILPIIKGCYFEEGDINNEKIYDSVTEIHDLYAEWIFLFKHKYIVNSSYNTEHATCPIPKVSNNVTTFNEIPLKILFKNKNDSTSPFERIKREVDKFVATNTTHPASFKVPEVVDVPENKTLASESRSSEGTVMNERLTAFLQILFAKPVFDADGDLSFLEPATISDNLQEILTLTSNTSQQARMVLDAMKVLLDEIASEKYYLSRNLNFPFISNTVITYALQSHYHSESIDVDLDFLKKLFSILALLPPPRIQSEEYCGFVSASRNVEVDRMLDQPDEKRAVMRKDIFLKGRQESIDDVISFISNIIAFTRFWVKMWDDNNDDHPLVIEMIMRIADCLSSSEYRRFDDRFHQTAPYMYHTLVCYIFNIFSSFVKLAKNPNIVRKLKIENKISVKDIQTPRILIRTLMEQLHLCMASSSLQMIFSAPPVSYKIFFPVTKKRVLVEKTETELVKKRKLGGSILNNTGKRITFPKNLEKQYCRDFLDSNRICKHGNNCNFVHAIYPSGFTKNDKILMAKHIGDTDGLSAIKDNNVSQD